jgi:site-specific recombinase
MGDWLEMRRVIFSKNNFGVIFGGGDFMTCGGRGQLYIFFLVGMWNADVQFIIAFSTSNHTHPPLYN